DHVLLHRNVEDDRRQAAEVVDARRDLPLVHRLGVDDHHDLAVGPLAGPANDVPVAIALGDDLRSVRAVDRDYPMTVGRWLLEDAVATLLKPAVFVVLDDQLAV